MEFFTHYVHEKGVPSALEEFIFSRKANVGTSTSTNVPPLERQPQMMSRFFNGVLHPMIHVGYGAEFHLPGMIVEGALLASIHSVATSTHSQSFSQVSHKQPLPIPFLNSYLIYHSLKKNRLPLPSSTNASSTRLVRPLGALSTTLSLHLIQR